jgi:PAS domain S-box-containing protein
MEEDRRSFEERLSALHNYSQELNLAKSMEEIYELTLDAAEKTLGFEFADILIVEGKMLRLNAHRGFSKNLSLKLPLDGDKGITARAAGTGKPVYVPDISKEKAYVEGGEGICSELAVPMKIGDRVVGVLNVESRRLDAFSERDEKLLEILASHAATAISNLEHARNLEAYAREIRESQEKFERLFMDNPEAAVYLGPDFHILDVNPRFSELFGYPPEEIKDKHIDDVVVPKNKMKEAIMLGKRFLEGYTYHDTFRKRKDGSLVPVSISGAPITVEGKIIGTVAVYKDITGRKKAEEALRRAEEQARALNTYSRNLNMADSMEEICQLTLDAMKKTLGFEHASFMIVEKDKLCIVDQHGYPESISLKLPLNGTKGGITIKAVSTRSSILVPDTKKEKAYFEVMPGIRSELAVPMEIGDRVVGVLNVESKRLDGFNEKDQRLLEILASHAATAIRNLRYDKKLQELVQEVRKRSEQLAALMRSSTEIIHTTDLRQRLKVIAEAIRGLGWRRVVISPRDEDLEPLDMVTAGLTEEEVKVLHARRASGHVWRDRFGPKFQRYKIGEFYYLPWEDSWVREYVHGISSDTPPEKMVDYIAGVPSKISPEEMVDWHPQDMLYAPLRLPEGRIVGIISTDDPLDGRRPTKESLTPLELFVHQAAVAIENAQLIKDLETARNQVKEYADQLELKVEERTRELMESERKYSTLVEHANDGVVIIQDGRLSFFNKRAEEMLGYSREELTGKLFVDMVPESEVELLKNRYEARMKGEPVPTIYETRAVSKDGDVIPVEVNIGVTDYGGDPALLVIVRDISERKKMEEKLLKAEKLAAIGELAASVGHDLRNPLTGMSGAVYYLKMKLASKIDEKTAEMLDLIEDDIRYSNKIVNDLLDFSGEIHLNRTEVGIKSLIRETLSKLGVPKEVEILDSTRNTPKVLVDVHQMMRAFQNLITNAIQAMPKGGRLEIKSKRINNSLKITFKDTGVGISRKNLSKLFTPLFTTKAKGVGMGLAICKRIINAHGGSISIKSEEGQGTLVTVTIRIRENNKREEWEVK